LEVQIQPVSFIFCIELSWTQPAGRVTAYWFRPVTLFFPFFVFYLQACVKFTHARYKRRVIKMQGGGELKVTSLFFAATFSGKDAGAG
jgi:hypothetical protein